MTETRAKQLFAACIKTAAIEVKARDLCRQAKIAGIPPKQFGQFLMKKHPDVWEHVVKTKGKFANAATKTANFDQFLYNLDQFLYNLTDPRVITKATPAAVGWGIGRSLASPKPEETDKEFKKRRRRMAIIGALSGFGVPMILPWVGPR